MDEYGDKDPMYEGEKGEAEDGFSPTSLEGVKPKTHTRRSHSVSVMNNSSSSPGYSSSLMAALAQQAAARANSRVGK